MTRRAPRAARGEPADDADAAVRQLYEHHARDLRRYVERSCPDQAGAEDIVQETFIRAWRHLSQLSSGDLPARPWLYRVARNLLIDADRAARPRPVTVPSRPAEVDCDDTGTNRVLDQQLVTDALGRLSPAHRTVLVETFYQGHTLAKVARQLEIPDSTARSRLHYALKAQAGAAAGLVSVGLAAAAVSLWTARGCQQGTRWSGWAAFLIGTTSGPQAAASGFHALYAIPDTATAALGVLVAAGVLATVGRTRRPAPPQTHSPDRTVHLPL